LEKSLNGSASLLRKDSVLQDSASFALLQVCLFTFFSFKNSSVNIVGNLVPRAIAYHAWYRKEFPDYPKTRKIIIPLIF
jgi:hypothetical protein